MVWVWSLHWVESPFGPALVNTFTCSFENKWLEDCPHSLKPFVYRRHVDDVFVLFSSLNHAEKFKGSDYYKKNKA